MSTPSKNQYDDCWKYFEKIDKDTAKCNVCSKPISCKGSSTTGLHRHLEHVHSMKRIPKDNRISLKRAKIGKEQSSITLDTFFKSNRPSINEIVSKLAAKDGMSIRQICTSDFIRNSLKTLGFTLSKQPRDVMKIIFDYYDEIKGNILKNIKKKQLENKKVSLSIDEWTSLRNHRYLNIHVYYSDNESYNLGLVRMYGSCPSERLIELVEEKLKSFELSFEKDVVATTSDGASVMVKFGRLSPAAQQLCYNHAIHLAVTSVLYCKKPKDQELSDTDTNEFDFESKYGSSASDLDDDDENLIPEDCFLLTNDMNIHETIKKIRNIVKLFKNSPVKNFVLQKYVKSAEKKELSLFLDCRTRWNSLFTMLERFLRVILPIQKALDELNLSGQWSIEHTYTAKCIFDTLRPVKVAIEALSRADANLLTSEGILKFLFNTLETETSKLSQKLLVELKLEISKRRDKSLISLVKFLQDPNFSREHEGDDFLSFTSKADIVKLAKTFMKRLFSANINDYNEINSEIPITDCSNDKDEDVIMIENINLNKLLEKSIRDSLKQAQPVADQNFSSFSREINLYELTGNITTNLELLRTALLTIRPTSTQNERNFSVSGNFVTIRRTRLTDKSVDCLCFLKHYFMKQ